MLKCFRCYWCDLSLSHRASPLLTCKQYSMLHADVTGSTGIRHFSVPGSFLCHMTSLTTFHGFSGVPLCRWGMQAQASGRTCSRSPCLLVLEPGQETRPLNSQVRCFHSYSVKDIIISVLHIKDKGCIIKIY